MSAFCAALVCLGCTLLPAEEPSTESTDGPLAGHSLHGEVFNEGPRRQAILMGGTGDVHFPVTSEVDEVQDFFDQGIGQLHGFWYLEAERSFRQAAMLDPNCAMAYWGAAMANQNNSRRARGFVEKAVEARNHASLREQAYIDALADYVKEDKTKDKKVRAENKKKRAGEYTRALEDIVFDYPDDIEARALLIQQLWYNKDLGLPITSYYAFDALLEDLFAIAPDHPAHHYRIHLWDKRRAELAIESSARCGQSAPAIAHMWHMPGHIFSRLHRYQDAAWQQEASARVDHAHMIRERLQPDQIFNFAHNNEWLIRNLIHVGRVDDAIALAKNMISLPRHPKYNSIKKQGSWRFGRQRLMQVLVEYERWDDLLRLSETAYLKPIDQHDDRVMRLRAVGAALMMTGEYEQGEARIRELRELRDAEKKEQQEAVEKAVDAARKKYGKSKEAELEKRIAAARKKAEKTNSKKISTIEKAIATVSGYFDLHRGKYKSAAKEFAKSDVDPSLTCESMMLAGNADEAVEKIEEEFKDNPGEVIVAARRVYILDAIDEADETEPARTAFFDLQEISSSIDMKSNIFERLNPIAEKLAMPEDWRQPNQVRDDVGTRPALDSLGPIAWKPSSAPTWSLPDKDGESVSSDELAGKPHLLIFFLGHGCLHCAEQLQHFDTEAEKFIETGIPIFAISSDEAEGLRKSIEDFDGELAIPLLSDGDLDVFKKFGAYDDFEDQPLHGTFLVDSAGRIRWQDISFEPFGDPDFLLEESQRLLAIEP